MPIVYADPLKGRPREAARIPAPTSVVLREQFAQTFEENPIMATKRFMELRTAERTGTRIDANQAREQLKGAGLERDLTVDETGITQAALDTLMERKRTELRRQEIFSRAEGGFAQGAARLGIAAATTLADPVSAGLNFVPIVGQARYAKWLAGVRGLGGRLGVRAAVGAAEGAAGAAIVEPLIYASRTAEQADYDAVDSLLNVAFGGMLGTAMHTTVGTLGEVFVRSRPGVTTATPAAPRRVEPTLDSAADIARAMKPADFQATVRAAVGQAVEGRAIDVESVVRAADVRQTELPAFKAWFGESKIVDDLGQPLRLYHGTAGDFDAFKQGSGEFGPGLYATDSQKSASGYAHRAGDARQDAAPSVMPVYISMKNPLDLSASVPPSLRGDFTQGTIQRSVSHAADHDAALRILRKYASENGHDGLIIRRGREREFVAFDPTQIKSAIGNSGRFDPRSGSLTDSGKAVDDVPRGDIDVSRAEEVLAREKETGDPVADRLTTATEEATLAEADLRAIEERLGIELKDEAYEAVADAVKNSERWAKTAELATVCLMRGG